MPDVEDPDLIRIRSLNLGNFLKVLNSWEGHYRVSSTGVIFIDLGCRACPSVIPNGFYLLTLGFLLTHIFLFLQKGSTYLGPEIQRFPDFSSF
jgi:hypothetical protein